jgi:hypothetical protein
MNNTNEILAGLELARMLLEGGRKSYVVGDHHNNMLSATVEAVATAAVNAAIKELQRIPAQEDLQDTSRADAEHIEGMDSETKYWVQRALASETEVKRLEDKLKEVGERLAQYEDAELAACENLSENSALTEDQIAQMWSPHPEGAVRRPILGWNKVVDFARNVERAVVLSAKAEVWPFPPSATAICHGPWPVIECKEAFDGTPMEKCLEAVPAFTSQDPDLAKIVYENLSSLYEEEEAKTGITDDQIREVFLKAGFTIKPGQDDLKPYVFEAARALLALASHTN